MSRPPYSSRTQAYVRARALANMLGQVRIIRPTRSGMDSNLLITSIEASLIYTGPARIYATNGGGALIVGEGITQTSSTTISLPYDAAAPHIDDVVLVLSFGADTELADDAYTVRDVGGGGLLRATRQLSCTAYQANRWWE